MKIEDIIYMLNKHMELEREKLSINSKGHFILHKAITPHNIMKAYKEVKIDLWYVEKNYKEIVLSNQVTERIISGQEDSTMDRLCKNFVLDIFNWMKTENYTKILKGNNYETT